MLQTIFFLSLVILFGYTLRINWRLRSVYKSHAALEELTKSATHLFQETFTHLQKDQSLKQEIEALLKKGEALRQDLYFLIDRSEGIANHLEKEVRRLRIPKNQDVDGQEIRVMEPTTSPFQKIAGGN